MASLHTCERDKLNPAIRSAKVTAERCTRVETLAWSCGLESPMRDNYGSPLVPCSPRQLKRRGVEMNPPARRESCFFCSFFVFVQHGGPYLLCMSNQRGTPNESWGPEMFHHTPAITNPLFLSTTSVWCLELTFILGMNSNSLTYFSDLELISGDFPPPLISAST